MPQSMNVFFKSLSSDKIIIWSFFATLSLILTSLILTIFFYSHLPPVLPLFNQMPWGEARLGTRAQIFIPISIAFLIFIGNLVFSATLYEKMPLVSRIICITSFLISLFTLLFIIRTFQIIV